MRKNGGSANQTIPQEIAHPAGRIAGEIEYQERPQTLRNKADTYWKGYPGEINYPREYYR
jgi:hypothetical protein